MVVPAAVREELAEHAQAESPNEACGLVVMQGRRRGALRRRAATRPRLPTASSWTCPPETWFLEDDGYELAVFHSHLSSPPRPSRTDVENIGLWAGTPVPHLHGAHGRARRLADLQRLDRAARARPWTDPYLMVNDGPSADGETDGFERAASRGRRRPAQEDHSLRPLRRGGRPGTRQPRPGRT